MPSQAFYSLEMDVLDEKDRKLLNALKQNARASLVTLAREIDLSRSATHDRIVRLEERGVIQSYTIIEKPSVSPNLRAFLTVQLEPSTRDTDIAPTIYRKAGVDQAYCLAGDIDILVDCACHSMDELSILREDIAALPGVRSVHTRMVLNTQ